MEQTSPLDRMYVPGRLQPNRMYVLQQPVMNQVQNTFIGNNVPESAVNNNSNGEWVPVIRDTFTLRHPSTDQEDNRPGEMANVVHNAQTEPVIKMIIPRNSFVPVMLTRVPVTVPNLVDCGQSDDNSKEVPKVIISKRFEGGLTVWTAGGYMEWMNGPNRGMSITAKDLDVLRTESSIKRVDVRLARTLECGKSLLRSIDKLVKSGVFIDWLLLKCEACQIPFTKISNQINFYSINDFRMLRHLISQSSCIPLPIICQEKDEEVKYFFINFATEINKPVSKLNSRIFYDVESSKEILVTCDLGIRLECHYLKTFDRFVFRVEKKLIPYAKEHMTEIRNLIVYNHVVWGYLQNWVRCAVKYHRHQFTLKEISENLMIERAELSEIKHLSDVAHRSQVIYFLVTLADFALYIKFAPSTQRPADSDCQFTLDNFETPVISTAPLIQYYRQFFYINDTEKSNALPCLLDFSLSSHSDYLSAGEIFQNRKIRPKGVPETHPGKNDQTVRTYENKKLVNKETQQPLGNQTTAQQPTETAPSKPLLKTRTVEEINSSIGRNEVVIDVEAEARESDKKTNESEDQIVNLLKTGSINKEEIKNTLLPFVRESLDDCYKNAPERSSNVTIAPKPSSMIEKFQQAVAEADRDGTFPEFLKHVYGTLQRHFENSACRKIMDCMIYKELEFRYNNSGQRADQSDSNVNGFKFSSFGEKELEKEFAKDEKPVDESGKKRKAEDESLAKMSNLTSLNEHFKYRMILDENRFKIKECSVVLNRKEVENYLKNKKVGESCSRTENDSNNFIVKFSRNELLLRKEDSKKIKLETVKDELEDSAAISETTGRVKCKSDEDESTNSETSPRRVRSRLMGRYCRRTRYRSDDESCINSETSSRKGRVGSRGSANVTLKECYKEGDDVLFTECLTRKSRVIITKLEDVIGLGTDEPRIKKVKLRRDETEECKEGIDKMLGESLEVVDGRIRLRKGYRFRGGLIERIKTEEISDDDSSSSVQVIKKEKLTPTKKSPEKNNKNDHSDKISETNSFSGKINKTGQISRDDKIIQSFKTKNSVRIDRSGKNSRNAEKVDKPAGESAEKNQIGKSESGKSGKMVTEKNENGKGSKIGRISSRKHFPSIKIVTRKSNFGKTDKVDSASKTGKSDESGKDAKNGKLRAKIDLNNESEKSGKVDESSKNKKPGGDDKTDRSGKSEIGGKPAEKTDQIPKSGKAKETGKINKKTENYKTKKVNETFQPLKSNNENDSGSINCDVRPDDNLSDNSSFAREDEKKPEIEKDCDEKSSCTLEVEKQDACVQVDEIPARNDGDEENVTSSTSLAANDDGEEEIIIVREMKGSPIKNIMKLLSNKGVEVVPIVTKQTKKKGKDFEIVKVKLKSSEVETNDGNGKDDEDVEIIECSYQQKSNDDWLGKECETNSKVRCGRCKETFDRLKDLKKHEKSKHSNAAVYDCAFCDKKFCAMYYLEYHVKKKHEKNRDCEYCRVTMPDDKYLEHHLKSKKHEINRLSHSIVLNGMPADIIIVNPPISRLKNL